MKDERKYCQPKQKTRTKLHRKVFERIRNKNGENLVNLRESNILEAQVILLSELDLPRTLFSVESTINIKIKIAHHRVIGDGCILEEISIMNTC